jgi:hypothetical protein
MREIPKEVLQILEKFYNKFNADTTEPKSIIRDGIGQFIAVGKLKNPTFQHGSNVDIITTRIVSFTDGLDVKESRIDLTYDVFEKYKQCCEDVLKRWND